MTLSPAPKPKKILYIEDNPSNATLVKRILQPKGYTVIIAETGLKGIDAALEHKPDLILMDINLPDMSGREVTTRLRAFEQFRDLPIVALTAQTDDKQRAMTLISGVSGFMAKPIDVASFPKRISFYLEGGKDLPKVANPEEARRNYHKELTEHLEKRLRDLEAANSKLRQLDVIKDDFIKRTAHELRTPLTIIYGYGRLLQTAPAVQQLIQPHPEIGAYVDALVESVERLHDVINEIFTVYRLTTGQIELNIAQSNLGEIVQYALDDFKQAAQQRNINVEFVREGWPTKLMVDFELLRLALANVIGNAIKFTPDGGKVSINHVETPDIVKITIRDSGIGIPVEEQHRIFDSFYSFEKTEHHSTSKTAFRGGGLGLGLSICKSIIEAHGGKIHVESQGQDAEKMPGSAFHIEIPLTNRGRTQAPIAVDVTPVQ
ncbi:MAG: hybrid sensor histidine kinase/response regulator [Chloroflexi bacterium]|nr:hybrid sensor histidine kinase/response regulator [Chloroflexota bacterium]